MTLRRLRQRLRGERGYSLVEMMIVLAMMGVVMGSLTTVFVAASNAELDMNNRFRAQLNARIALDKLRNEVHCASAATPAGSASSVMLTLPSYCKTTGVSTASPCSSTAPCATWCTRNVGTNRYALYRVVGATCGTSGGTKWADYLVPSTAAPTCGSPTALCIFTYTAQSSSSLAKLHVDFPVDIKPTKTTETYELVDDIVLRNSTRS
jgi:prepilin-type N-terminal cleavage/methylation domain-containing protein